MFDKPKSIVQETNKTTTSKCSEPLLSKCE